MFLIKLIRNNNMVKYALRSKGIILEKNHVFEACDSKSASGLINGKILLGTEVEGIFQIT